MIDDEQRDPGATARPGRLILTIYGLYARQRQGWLPIAAVVRMMAELGVTVQAVRSATHRLKRRGLLLAERRGGVAGYALSDDARGLLAGGDVRIFGRHHGAVEDGWLLVVFSLPTEERARRYQLRSTLIRLGLGTVSPGTWVAPRHLEGAVRETLERLGLLGFTQLFAGPHVSGGDLAELVGQWWDLDGLQALYSEFLGEVEPIGKRWAAAGTGAEDGPDAQAFADHVEILTAWRRLPYADPGLPLELLPAEWDGVRAERVFAQLFDRLAEPAARHSATVLG